MAAKIITKIIIALFCFEFPLLLLTFPLIKFKVDSFYI